MKRALPDEAARMRGVANATGKINKAGKDGHRTKRTQRKETPGNARTRANKGIEGPSIWYEGTGTKGKKLAPKDTHSAHYSAEE